MRFVLKKILTLAVTVLAISFIVFLAFSVIPGDPALMLLGGESDPAKVEALRQKMGLNDPVIVQYERWLAAFLRGDMGTSYKYSMPVTRLLADKVPITLALSAEAFLLMVVLSIPLGIYSAKHEGSAADRFLVVCNQVVMAIPPFFSGILITYLFGMLLHLFTPGGYVSFREDLGAFFAYLFFPALAIAIPKIAMAVKLLRSSVLTESKKDYVRTAYSRGNSTNSVLYGHVLKNALLPAVTFFGMAIADMIAGSIIIEQVFGIPGLGKTLLTSIGNRDYPVIEAIIVLIAVIVVASNVLVDILYQVLDPRIEID
ncbi:MAG: ABC transporter permease [Lachnospiraceae bacterium]|jgi:peptide/nickel transport system permease protein|nr:ABC transporter permease [Lachnospiraceae bacterium]